MSDSLPVSSLFTTYRSYIPNLVGAGAAALAGAYIGGSTAAKYIDRDSSRFPTWTDRSVRPSKMRIVRRSRPRRRYVRRVPRPVSGLETIRQSCSLGALNGGASDVLQIFSFKLSDLADASSISGVWARYRFRWVKLYLVPTTDSGNSNASGTTAVAQNIIQVVTASDTGTTSAAATVNAVCAYRDARIHCLGSGRMATHFVRYPTPANTIAGSNLPGGPQWITTANATIPHYSILVGWRVPTANMSMQVYATYCIEVAGRY